jgi:hypothetical protein
MWTVLPIHRDISVGVAVIVVASNKVSRRWNGVSSRDLVGSGLIITLSIKEYKVQVLIRQIVGLVTRIVKLEPRAVALAHHDGINHELGNDHWRRLRRCHDR